ncbi:ADP-ribosylglycohydrolase [Acidovorax sp. 69]|uniref:ADP-ribosylglycohydrolase family protein n=1 Tax=Acidovorax sp. 69 TaxID=2035202 RepID=UPI000C243CDB|nr:ADP-ribosylglycohydrolase family protein [Acidovorax sp. 69]PJI96755.1 ADP-ribosylglycohydrolase [Acidovorax sp. 69]
MNSIRNLAQGCLLGALVGDAAGSRLEFLGRKPTQADVAEALAMKGGGVFGLAPGQITDDGEMTLSLARSLAGSLQFPREKVAANYRAWVASKPFDMGQATYAALGGPIEVGEAIADAVSSRAAIYNMGSKANGALMRASALGIWSTGVSPEDAVRAACGDTRLTHPNPSCLWAGAAYVVAIRHLLLHPDDSMGAFELANWALSLAPKSDSAEVYGWLEDASNGKLPDGQPSMGFVRIAFVHAFHHMLRGTPFFDALQNVLGYGGDTDTNACIVGGLVGARVGLTGIPGQMIDAVLSCDTAKGRTRPDWLSPKDALELAQRILND